MWSRDLPLSKKGRKRSEPWPPLQIRAVLGCKSSTRQGPEGCHSSKRRLRRGPDTSAALRATLEQWQRWMVRAEQPRVKDPPFRRLLPQYDGGKVPLLVHELFRALLSSSSL